MEQKEKIIVIVGPTASGKSALAVTIAKNIGGEIISADSRQIYQGLTIGTGKITKSEMHGIPHHLLDIANPKQIISVVTYEQHATQAILNIIDRGTTPILCGGTGLYIDTVLTRTTFPSVLPNKKLRTELSKLSTTKLFEKLIILDPDRAATIDAKNPHRLIRAIEIATAIGNVPLTTYNLQSTISPYDSLIIGLALPPEELTSNIHARLIKRLRRGMVAEVCKLHNNGLSWKRLETLGIEYKFISQFLQNKISRDEMISSIEKESRHYAKRQMLWFKRNKKIYWFHPNDHIKIVGLVNKFFKK